MEVYAYRLVKRKYQDTAFDGEGARLYGGRWNSPGRACVYVASSESLALLEIMVHLESYRLLDAYALLRLTLPAESILRVGAEDLPDNWQEAPAPAETADLGDGWLTSGQSLALALPSVVVPREFNYMLNPGHPLFDPIVAAAEPLPFKPDPRL
ncbi:RES family NAD+ phosphorylase [Salinicola sp. LHM]|jgi:RES domain-containing protein|uniref:RES family NAD+ phosphorylase n=1 Tax=unclassified Salinicola TaxID=2634022 RepID=UPI002ACEB196|nr:RES family NAD+ phosphorylase [Salinicola sp. LHM]WQH34940.1 RES family NAD+ phosphorylase [Salinicola sp. LHM]